MRPIVHSTPVLNSRFELNVATIKDLGFDPFFGYLYNDLPTSEIWA